MKNEAIQAEAIINASINTNNSNNILKSTSNLQYYGNIKHKGEYILAGNEVTTITPSFDTSLKVIIVYI
jgi:hypothetical protein